VPSRLLRDPVPGYQPNADSAFGVRRTVWRNDEDNRLNAFKNKLNFGSIILSSFRLTKLRQYFSMKENIFMYLSMLLNVVVGSDAE
jgi:hypothetical protein